MIELNFDIFIRCGHDIPVDPVNCVLDVVGRRNLRHFFIATGDKTLETQLLKVFYFLFSQFLIKNFGIFVF